MHVPLTAPQSPVGWQVEVGAGEPVKPVLHVAVQTRPTAEVAPQLKAPLAGFVGLFEQVVVVERVHDPVTVLHIPLDWHVEVGEPVKPAAHVAVQVLPLVELAPQLKAPLAGFGGLPEQVGGGGPLPIIMSAQSATRRYKRQGSKKQ